MSQTLWKVRACFGHVDDMHQLCAHCVTDWSWVSWLRADFHIGLKILRCTCWLFSSLLLKPWPTWEIVIAEKSLNRQIIQTTPQLYKSQATVSKRKLRPCQCEGGHFGAAGLIRKDVVLLLEQLETNKKEMGFLDVSGRYILRWTSTNFEELFLEGEFNATKFEDLTIGATERQNRFFHHHDFIISV